MSDGIEDERELEERTTAYVLDPHWHEPLPDPAPVPLSDADARGLTVEERQEIRAAKRAANPPTIIGSDADARVGALERALVTLYLHVQGIDVSEEDLDEAILLGRLECEYAEAAILAAARSPQEG